MWDAVMNYLFTRACIAFFIGEAVDRDELAKTSFRHARPDRCAGLPPSDRAAAQASTTRTSRRQLNLLDSHDMPRFLTLARGDLSALAAGDPLPDDLPRRPVDLLRRRDRPEQAATTRSTAAPSPGTRPRPGTPACSTTSSA